MATRRKAIMWLTGMAVSAGLATATLQWHAQADTASTTSATPDPTPVYTTIPVATNIGGTAQSRGAFTAADLATSTTPGPNSGWGSTITDSGLSTQH